MTFGKWRQQVRLMQGMRLLAEGAKVTHAALESGYSTPSAFISMFRKALGITPSSYFRKGAELNPPGSREWESRVPSPWSLDGDDRKDKKASGKAHAAAARLPSRTWNLCVGSRHEQSDFKGQSNVLKKSSVAWTGTHTFQETGVGLPNPPQQDWN